MDVLHNQGHPDGVVSLDGPWLDDLDPIELEDFPYSLLSSLPEPGATPGLQTSYQHQQEESRQHPGVPERGQRSAERREKGKLAQVRVVFTKTVPTAGLLAPGRLQCVTAQP